LRTPNKSVTTKLTFTILFLSILAGGLVLIIAINEESKAMENNIIENNKHLAKVAAQSVEAGYANQIWPWKTLKEINESQDVLFWWVVDGEGSIYLADDVDMWGNKIDSLTYDRNDTVVKDYFYSRTGEKIKLIIEPLDIMSSGQKWGLCLGISLKSVHEATNALVLNSLGYFIAIIVLTIVISFYLARGFTKPIKQLGIATKQISKGNLSQRVNIKTEDEFGLLASSFNKMAEDLAKSHAQIKDHSKTLEKKVEERTVELARSNAELEQFAYVASHDLQEPLRMVSSYVKLLERRYKDNLDKDADEFIAYAVDGATRMQQLINDLLTYSRVGTKGKPFEPTDSETVFKLATDNLKVAIEESGAVITHDPLPSVMADSSQLIQLLQNLIGNGIKFRGEEPLKIYVSAAKKKNEWLFSVSDNGIGIDPKDKERIFQIFQRLHSSNEYQGTGIGLAVSKKIVERHGGRIWVESKPKKGSTFYFTIPNIGSERR
jgi:signal transduction histidine kinase